MASITENPDDFFSPVLPECRASSQPSLPQFIISWQVDYSTTSELLSSAKSVKRT